MKRKLFCIAALVGELEPLYRLFENSVIRKRRGAFVPSDSVFNDCRGGELLFTAFAGVFGFVNYSFAVGASYGK